MNTVKISNWNIETCGKIIRVAAIKDEIWIIESLSNPHELINQLIKTKVKADVFTFYQDLPNTKAEFKYFYEYDNFACLNIVSYDNWFKNQINAKTRNMIRKSQKQGVVVKIVDYNQDIVEGINDIYNETPVRQRKSFKHYGKSIEETYESNVTFVDRSTFIAAYYKDEFIGFIKIVKCKNVSIVMQILSKIKHRDKAPTNALLAKAVEVCASNNEQYLIYGNYSYGNKGEDSLTDFKKKNGFQKLEVPHYYIPLTLKGKMAIKLHLHRGVKGIIPGPIIKFLLLIRKEITEGKYSGLFGTIFRVKTLPKSVERESDNLGITKIPI